MTIRRTRQLLRLTGTAFTAAALITAAWGACWPCRLPDVKPRQSSGDHSDSGNAVPLWDLPSLEEFAKFWETPLRRPLLDVAPGAAAATAGSMATSGGLPLNVNLVGTIVEPGHSRAVFSTPNGGIELKGIGETIGGLPGGTEIVEIEPKHVVVRFQGQLTTLRLKGADEN